MGPTNLPRVPLESSQENPQPLRVVTAAVRGWMARKEFSAARSSIVVLQSVVRMFLAKRHYQQR